MAELLAQTKVLAQAAVSWLIIIQVVLQTILVEVDDIPWVVQYGGQALALVGGIILVLRRVTEVDKAERGILPT